MPYKIVKQKDKYCVMNTDTGENKGCSDSEDMAKQHMAALYANEKKPGKKDMESMKLSQAETNYGAANGTVGKACSVCRWYCPPDDMEEGYCHLVDDEPAPITPNGLCDRYEAIPVQQNEPPAPIPVTIVEPMDSEEMALPTTRRGLVDIIKDTLKALTELQDEPAFSVFKSNGKHYWLARHTGKWVDREHEIIADKAHEDYVNRVQSGKVPLPELWVWHKKGTRHGQADYVWKAGGFVLALGHFDETPEAQKAIAYYQKHKGKIKLSHMFNYPKRAKDGRVFYAYNTVEITTLPDGAEAFPYTSFEEVAAMPFTKSQEETIRAIGGDEMWQRALAADGKALIDTEKLDKNGVESKGLDNFEGSSIPADKDIEALKAQAGELETRLKAVEGLPGTLEALQAAMKTLHSELQDSQQRESKALEKINALEKKLLEYQAVAPPATQAKDTLLNARDKSLLEQIAQQAKTENTPSLINLMAGQQPAVSG